MTEEEYLPVSLAFCVILCRPRTENSPEDCCFELKIAASAMMMLYGSKIR